MHSWTSITSCGWIPPQNESSMLSTTLYTGSKSTGQSFKKLASVPTTQQCSRYPVSMPWYITDFTLRNLVPQLAYVRPLPSQNTNPPSSDPGADQIDVRLSSRSSSRTRGMINLQVPTEFKQRGMLEGTIITDALRTLFSSNGYNLPLLNPPSILSASQMSQSPEDDEEDACGPENENISSKVILGKARGV